MAINLTEKAAAEIRRVRDEQKLEEEMFLRIGVA
ncbi:MAG: HesB/IscA family protein, partial [Pirellulaceae bacterium]